MQEGDHLLDNVKKIKAFADQLVCLQVHVWRKTPTRLFLKRLLASYEYLITALEMMPIRELTMEYMTKCLMHEILKHKKKKSQSNDTTMVSHQSKANDPSLWQGVKMYFYCG